MLGLVSSPAVREGRRSMSNRQNGMVVSWGDELWRRRCSRLTVTFLIARNRGGGVELL